ncbi:unnamed protein product [Caenorhabditis auriculariae]|uniref:HSF-type DNA-binding domain-containing protein n=1 Tax=Caenorhabditis auriculariae TaxID=2777116 RepID=A0A8S1GU91_9PELO|nr:unnamed protein product [Caenorhabditis auriculariae]
MNRLPKPERGSSPPRVALLNTNNPAPRTICQIFEEIPTAQLQEVANQPARFDEEKLPLFLIKLWNIVEDPNIQQIVHWDESGHNNLNSLIRQLNMYGFRKMTPLNQGGLTRTESDQDHLEFSHPYFVQNHPELLGNIKRKQSGKGTEEKSSVQTQQSLDMVLTEMRSLREKQRSMETKINEITKENRTLWDQMQSMRQQYNRQNHIVNKLVQFLVSMVQPNISKRVNKRGVLAIDDYTSPQKRPRNAADAGPPVPNPGALNPINFNTSANANHLSELLELLQRDGRDSAAFRRAPDAGPVIAEVTDETGSPIGHFSSREASPQPLITNPSPRRSFQANATQPARAAKPTTASVPTTAYMGSGAYTIDMAPSPPSATKYSPVPSTSSQQPRFTTPAAPRKNLARESQNLSAMSQNLEQLLSNNFEEKPLLPPPNTSLQLPDRSDTFSPTISMSPSLERQISQELQDYLSGVDFSIDNCRDLLAAAGTEWNNYDFMEDFGDDSNYGMNGGGQLALEGTSSNPLELEYNPTASPQKVIQDGEVAHSNIANPALLDNLDETFPVIPDQDNLDQFPTIPQLPHHYGSPDGRSFERK